MTRLALVAAAAAMAGILMFAAAPRAEDNPLPPIFAAGKTVRAAADDSRASLARPLTSGRVDTRVNDKNQDRFCEAIAAVHGTWIQWEKSGAWQNMAMSAERWVACS